MNALENYVPEPNSGCWLWLGAMDKKAGYGKVRFRGRSMNAHRATYMAKIGDVPAGMEVDHLCRVRSCVNPTHLEVVTRTENWRRGEAPGGVLYRRKTVCDLGHKRTVPSSGGGGRTYLACAECRGNYVRRYRAANRDRLNAYKRALRARQK